MLEGCLSLALAWLYLAFVLSPVAMLLGLLHVLFVPEGFFGLRR